MISKGFFGEMIQSDLIKFENWIKCADSTLPLIATVIYHASLRLTGPEDKHGVENAGEKKFQAEFTPLDHR